MAYESMSRSAVTILVAGLPLAACRCADPAVQQKAPASSGPSSGEEWLSTSLSGSEAEPTTDPIDEPIDASRFLGVFHYEHDYFGTQVWSEGDVPPLWPPLVNVEIRPDGTAGMFMEPCVAIFDDRPVEVEWRWELGQDGWLELGPGPGEALLRFMEPTELASLRATIDDQCTMQFEADGELVSSHVFRRGRACWVNRCDPPWTLHVDYCDGEAPPPCE